MRQCIMLPSVIEIILIFFSVAVAAALAVVYSVRQSPRWTEENKLNPLSVFIIRDWSIFLTAALRTLEHCIHRTAACRMRTLRTFYVNDIIL